MHKYGHSRIFSSNTLSSVAELLGRKRGIFVLAAYVIAEEDSAMDTLAPSQPSQEITKSRRIGVLDLPGLRHPRSVRTLRRVSLRGYVVGTVRENRRTRLPVCYPGRHPRTGPDDVWTRETVHYVRVTVGRDDGYFDRGGQHKCRAGLQG